MLKNCVKDKCRFYNEFVEFAIDCCTFGASEEDKEIERGCRMANEYQFTLGEISDELVDEYKELLLE